LLPNGQVLVMGGLTTPSVSGVTATSELYNPGTGEWTLTSDMNTTRYAHTATLLHDGRVLVTGGINFYQDEKMSASTELYDPATGVWTGAGPLRLGRHSHTATLLDDGRVLVAGGYNPNVNTGIILSSVEIYDPANGSWSVTNSMTSHRYAQLDVLLPGGRILQAGGYTSTSGDPTPGVEAFDLATGVWTPTLPMSAPHANGTATLLVSGRVLVAGGYTYGFAPISTMELFNPLTGNWSPSAPLATARASHTATMLANGKVLFAGGDGGPNGVLNTSELYGAGLPAVILSTPATTPGGALSLEFNSTIGTLFTVLVSANPAAPANSWTVVGLASEISPGHFQFTDPQPASGVQRFYRLRSP
jgi:N-acetylneuraminic acid mutarotase